MRIKKEPIEKIKEIKLKLQLRKISYEDAKKEAIEPIQQMEKLAEKIAKKYNKKPPKFNFINLMR